MIMLASPPPRAAGLHPLRVPCPPHLARLLGWRGGSGYLGVSGWRQGPPRCWEGCGGSWEADWRSWLAWSGHPEVRAGVATLAANDWIVLSLVEEAAYHAPAIAAAAFLRSRVDQAPVPATGSDDLTGSRGRLRSEMTSWLDGYGAGRAARG